MFSINNHHRLLVLLFLKYENDNDAISDFHLLRGVVCNAANKRTPDIAENIKQILRREENERERKKPRENAKKRKKIEFRTCRVARGENAGAMF